MHSFAGDGTRLTMHPSNKKKKTDKQAYTYTHETGGNGRHHRADGVPPSRYYEVLYILNLIYVLILVLILIL